MLLEQTEGGSPITITDDGAEATREFVCEWDEAIYWAGYLKTLPHPEWPILRADRVSMTGCGKPGRVAGLAVWSHRKLTVNYRLAYRMPALGDPPRVTWEFASETLNNGQSRTWDTGGFQTDIDELPATIKYSLMIVTVDLCVAFNAVPWTAMDSLTDCINDDQFTITSLEEGTGQEITLLDAAAERLLYCNAQVAGQYNYEYGRWDFRLSHKFLWRPRSHNQAWRAAKRQWDADAYDWKRDTDGQFLYEAGAPGTAGWDETTPKFYDTGDFAGLGLT